MIDLTGDFLLTFLVREIKDVVLRHPRFRMAGGETLAVSSYGVTHNDVRVVVSSVSSEGTRLSPDYFMYNQMGHSVLAKLADKEGVFIEWVQEIPGGVPESAIYYLYVDSVDEQTRDMKLLVKKFKDLSGKLTSPAVGSWVFVRDGINGMSVHPSESGLTFTPYPDSILLTSFPTQPFQLLRDNGQPLIPLTDYWYEREFSLDYFTTSGGTERVSIPEEWLDYSLKDKLQGYTLRKGVDYFVDSEGILLNPYTPTDRVLEATYKIRIDPTTISPVHPENLIIFNLDAGDRLVPGEAWVQTSASVFHESDLIKTSEGFWMKSLLLPGYRCNWSVRVEAPDYSSVCSKNATNDNIIPGLQIAIGDKVFQGDELALIVTKDRTHTYEVYGSTENISFTISVSANDRDTVNDLSSMLKESLLVRSRDRHEAFGLTIYEASMSTTIEPRDAGARPSTTKEISIKAASNWRFFSPVVNQVLDIQLSVQPSLSYAGQLNILPYGEALGVRAWKGRTFTSNGTS